MSFIHNCGGCRREYACDCEPMTTTPTLDVSDDPFPCNCTEMPHHELCIRRDDPVSAGKDDLVGVSVSGAGLNSFKDCRVMVEVDASELARLHALEAAVTAFLAAYSYVTDWSDEVTTLRKLMEDGHGG